MTNLYNSAKFFDEKVEEIITALTGGKQHFRVPIDLEIKIDNLERKIYEVDDEDYIYVEGIKMFRDNRPMPYLFADDCFYGLVVVEQNYRFFPYVGEEITEIPVDDPRLLETRMEKIDNAGFYHEEPDGTLTFVQCPNVWKSIKPYKEMHSPIGLKAIPTKKDEAGKTMYDLNEKPILVDNRDYGDRVRIFEPLDACGNPIPEWDIDEWLVTAYNCPFVEVIEKVIALLKPEATLRDTLGRWSFPACYRYQFGKYEIPTEDTCTPRGIPYF